MDSIQQRGRCADVTSSENNDKNFITVEESINISVPQQQHNNNNSILTALTMPPPAKQLGMVFVLVVVVVLAAVLVDPFNGSVEIELRGESKPMKETSVSNERFYFKHDLTFTGEVVQEDPNSRIVGKLTEHMHSQNFRDKKERHEISEAHRTIHVAIIMSGIFGIFLVAAAVSCGFLEI